MKKFKWTLDLYDSDGDMIRGEFEMPDDAQLDAAIEQARVLASEFNEVRCWEDTVASLLYKDDAVDWSGPLEVVQFHDDEEAEVGNARLIGQTQSEGAYSQIVGISWNPPREEITFANPKNGKLKGERDNFIRNATLPPKEASPPSPRLKPGDYLASCSTSFLVAQDGILKSLDFTEPDLG